MPSSAEWFYHVPSSCPKLRPFWTVYFSFSRHTYLESHFISSTLHSKALRLLITAGFLTYLISQSIHFYTYKATLDLNFILSPDPSYFLCTNFSTTWPLSTLCLLLSFYSPLNQISAICMYMGGAIHLSISNLLAAIHQKKNVSSPLAPIKCQ